jgi:hypothetical protein
MEAGTTVMAMDTGRQGTFLYSRGTLAVVEWRFGRRGPVMQMGVESNTIEVCHTVGVVTKVGG